MLTQREIANQEKATYQMQQEAQRLRIDMEKTKGTADMQAQLAQAQVGVEIATETAAARKKQADPAFARRLVQPLVASMAESMLAMRFGNCTLTHKESARIEMATDLVLAASVGPESARMAFAELSKEIC